MNISCVVRDSNSSRLLTDDTCPSRIYNRIPGKESVFDDYVNANQIFCILNSKLCPWFVIQCISCLESWASWHPARVKKH